MQGQNRGEVVDIISRKLNQEEPLLKMDPMKKRGAGSSCDNPFVSTWSDEGSDSRTFASKAKAGEVDACLLVLYRARSRLYRSQILRVNMRLKALAKIYTIHSFAQL